MIQFPVCFESIKSNVWISWRNINPKKCGCCTERMSWLCRTQKYWPENSFMNLWEHKWTWYPRKILLDNDLCRNRPPKSTHSKQCGDPLISLRHWIQSRLSKKVTTWANYWHFLTGAEIFKTRKMSLGRSFWMNSGVRNYQPQQIPNPMFWSTM